MALTDLAKQWLDAINSQNAGAAILEHTRLVSPSNFELVEKDGVAGFQIKGVPGSFEAVTAESPNSLKALVNNLAGDYGKDKPFPDARGFIPSDLSELATISPAFANLFGNIWVTTSSQQISVEELITRELAEEAAATAAAAPAAQVVSALAIQTAEAKRQVTEEAVSAALQSGLSPEFIKRFSQANEDTKLTAIESVVNSSQKQALIDLHQVTIANQTGDLVVSTDLVDRMVEQKNQQAAATYSITPQQQEAADKANTARNEYNAEVTIGDNLDTLLMEYDLLKRSNATPDFAEYLSQKHAAILDAVKQHLENTGQLTDEQRNYTADQLANGNFFPLTANPDAVTAALLNSLSRTELEAYEYVNLNTDLTSLEATLNENYPQWAEKYESYKNLGTALDTAAQQFTQLPEAPVQDFYYNLSATASEGALYTNINQLLNKPLEVPGADLLVKYSGIYDNLQVRSYDNVTAIYEIDTVDSISRILRSNLAFNEAFSKLTQEDVRTLFDEYSISRADNLTLTAPQYAAFQAEPNKTLLTDVIKQIDLAATGANEDAERNQVFSRIYEAAHTRSEIAKIYGTSGIETDNIAEIISSLQYQASSHGLNLKMVQDNLYLSGFMDTILQHNGISHEQLTTAVDTKNQSEAAFSFYDPKMHVAYDGVYNSFDQSSITMQDSAFGNLMRNFRITEDAFSVYIPWGSAGNQIPLKITNVPEELQESFKKFMNTVAYENGQAQPYSDSGHVTLAEYSDLLKELPMLRVATQAWESTLGTPEQKRQFLAEFMFNNIGITSDGKELLAVVLPPFLTDHDNDRATDPVPISAYVKKNNAVVPGAPL